MSRASLIPPGVVLQGDLEGDGDLSIFGTVLGEAKVGGTLIVEQGGAVHGDVVGAAITIRGTLVGNARSTDRVEVESTASVVGDLHAPRIKIEEGARFRGRMHMEGAAGARTEPSSRAIESKPLEMPQAQGELDDETSHAERARRRRGRGRRRRSNEGPHQEGVVARLIPPTGGAPRRTRPSESPAAVSANNAAKPTPQSLPDLTAMPRFGRVRGAQR